MCARQRRTRRALAAAAPCACPRLPLQHRCGTLPLARLTCACAHLRAATGVRKRSRLCFSPLRSLPQVVMPEAFRPSDLVRARVLALGSMREYRLTTAEPELGVVWARSEAGASMEALSWREMRCPASEAVERRKVAKLAA
jgi:exosome complex RNA-binding protein Csl4